MTEGRPVRPLLRRYWYGADIREFCGAQPDAILGELVRNGHFTLQVTQRNAWIAQIRLLQTQLSQSSGSIFLEFSIPRMGRRSTSC